MEISSFSAQNLFSLRQALDIASIRNAMGQDAVTVDKLLDGMEAANAEILESSVQPHKGGSIDIRV